MRARRRASCTAMPPDLAAIRIAHERIRPHIYRTPVLTNNRLNAACGARLFFKCENLQKVGAFKARGATNAVLALPDVVAIRGVATHSSGKRLADAADIVIDTGAPIEDAIVPIKGWSRPVAGSSTVLAMIMMHELIAESAQKLADRGIELPVFASPTIAGVTLHDTDVIYGIYRERMIEAQQKHLPQFKKTMAAEG